MNRKAIIFTIDALVAFSIFIAVILAAYSMFSPKPEISIQNPAIYINSENFLRASDRAENLSQAFEKIQLGDSDTATEIIQNLLSELPYPAEMRLSVYDGGTLVNSLTVNEQDFETSIIVRKFLVLTLTENLGNMPNPLLAFNMQSSQAPAPIFLQVMVMGDQEPPSQEGEISTAIYDSAGQLVGWPINLLNPPPNFMLAPGEVRMFDYLVNIPPNAVIGEYNLSVSATGPTYNQFAYQSFNVIRYGIAELEVGTS